MNLKDSFKTLFFLREESQIQTVGLKELKIPTQLCVQALTVMTPHRMGFQAEVERDTESWLMQPFI
jgi:hypothetical protein